MGYPCNGNEKINSSLQMQHDVTAKIKILESDKLHSNPNSVTVFFFCNHEQVSVPLNNNVHVPKKLTKIKFIKCPAHILILNTLKVCIHSFADHVLEHQRTWPLS